VSEVTRDAKAWRDKNDAQIRRAVALIKPKASRRNKCMADLSDEIVEVALELVNRRHAHRDRTKPAKRAAASLARALRRAVAASNSADLGLGIHRDFPRDELMKWQRELEEAARTPSPRVKRQQGAEVKVRAVAVAYSLMRNYGAGVSATSSSSSAFVRLSNQLYEWVSDLVSSNRRDRRQVSLHNQCRAFLRERKKWGST
jgi:hypothetical protein